MTPDSPQPNVPLRVELLFELPGTPEQVWQAIATANGINSWFLPTDLDEREGGKIVTHMGETDSPGTVTGYEPHRRFAYEEPDWAALAGQEGANVTPLATEFLIEAQSGGTCVLRVVSSAFGTGADWEQEFLDEMERGWRPFFDRLRLYLTHFAGQPVTPLEASRSIKGAQAGPVVAAMRRSLGVDEVGQTVEARGVSGTVEQVTEDGLLLRVSDPVPGLLAFTAWDTGEDESSAVVHGHLFSDAAPAFVERERPGWEEWLHGLEISAA
jgi:uncharacterized protein YndB with AHSA1/START domain